jgi:2-methylisocitrate lyase-like PEP mutase family enzyme
LTNTHLQKQKAEQFNQLHVGDQMLMLPNIWDPLGALLLEDLGYPAIATASAAIAYANGYPDGEKIGFAELLVLLKKITQAVKIPVSADIESGYANNDIELRENIRSLIDIGVVGINIEDSDKRTEGLLAIETQSRKIRAIREVSEEKGIPLFINARTDVYLFESIFDAREKKLNEAIKRGLAYKQAGANGFYPITLKEKEDISELIAQVKLPLNILAVSGIPDLHTLSLLGVARISLGPSFLKISLQAMKEMASQLKNGENLLSVTENKMGTDYLKSLVHKNSGSGG